MRDAGDAAATFSDRDGSRNDVGADGGPFGALDTLAPQIFVTSFPSPAAGESPLALLFDARASQDEWGIASWEWDFDASDGVSVEGFGASVPVLYDAPGGYLVTLFVTDNSGFRSSATYSVRVDAPPAVAIEATPKAGPAPLAVGFNADVTSGEGLTFAWDFDSDGVADAQGDSPTYTYPAGTAPGVYNVTLTATDGAGVVTQVQSPITVTELAITASAELTPGSLTIVRVDDVASPINGARVTVPVNSVNGPLTVAISEVDEDDLALAPDGQIAGLINVSPSGLVFSRAVRIQLPLPTSFTNLAGLKVRYYDPSSQAWFDEGITSVRISETAPRTVSFETSHFTTFAVTVPGTPVEPKQFACGGGAANGGGMAGDVALVGALALVLVATRMRGRETAR
jgi:PKD repeat protein